MHAARRPRAAAGAPCRKSQAAIMRYCEKHHCSGAGQMRWGPRMQRRVYERLCERIKSLELPLVGSRVVRDAPRWFPSLKY